MSTSQPPVKKLTKAQRTLLANWCELKRVSALYKEQESEARAAVVKAFFGTLGEETKELLTSGVLLTATGKINRRIDEAALDAVMKEMPTNFQRAGALIDWKPVLVTKGYKLLTKQHRKVFEQALILTPGTPTLDITPVK
jgi:hypothetical protein